jgi:post-segregation antitoxin (ccd killing protein)
MARVNIYLPDDLAARARAAGVNVSAVARSALEAELASSAWSEWVAQVSRLPRLPVSHEEVLGAMDAARDELAARERA